MRIMIAAVGKMRAGPEAALTEDYIARAHALGRGLRLTGPEILECEAPKNLSGSKRREREGALLLKSISQNAHVVALDEKGRNWTSAGMAELLEQKRDDGAASIAFLIGGADGHGAEIKARAAQTLSFGAATWPHMLVRVMLAEQIYRAMTILSGHPYHRP